MSSHERLGQATTDKMEYEDTMEHENISTGYDKFHSNYLNKKFSLIGEGKKVCERLDELSQENKIVKFLNGCSETESNHGMKIFGKNRRFYLSIITEGKDAVVEVYAKNNIDGKIEEIENLLGMKLNGALDKRKSK